jgi:hypothetical protein
MLTADNAGYILTNSDAEAVLRSPQDTFPLHFEDETDSYFIYKYFAY